VAVGTKEDLSFGGTARVRGEEVMGSDYAGSRTCQLNDPRLQGEGFKKGRFEIDRRPRPPDLLLVMVPEKTGKRCFGAQTGRALKAQRATATAVSSHDATSPTLRFA